LTTTTHPQAPGGAPARTGPEEITGTYCHEIEGRYRRITTHQLAMAWWLHQAGHITRRQLRCYFAAHEMAERRRYTGPGERGGPLYGLQELKALIGGRGSDTATRDLSADAHRLGELGLVKISPHAITFASPIEQLALEDSLEDFWAFFQALPNRGRSVPVPRRTLRALAAGFSRAVTAVMLAALIRSVFWHKRPGGGGEYRIDGRTKLSWISATFGISRRAVTEARAHLIELGWLAPLETPQWQLNRWGVHDVVNVDWSPADAEGTQAAEPVDNSGPEEAGHSGGSATPPAPSSAGSASPCLNRSALPSGDSKTRRPGASPPGPAGDCISSPEQKTGSRKRRGQAARPTGKPNIRDIEPADLKDPEALRELRTQAVGLGFDFAGESGALDFFALAHRALTRGQRPGALFFDLISKHRTAFITIADEEAARLQLRELRDGPAADPRRGGGGERPPAPRRPELTEEERIVEACIQVAKQHRIEDPFRVARKAKGWTQDQWDHAYLSYRTAQMRRQQSLSVGGALVEMYR